MNIATKYRVSTQLRNAQYPDSGPQYGIVYSIGGCGDAAGRVSRSIGPDTPKSSILWAIRRVNRGGRSYNTPQTNRAITTILALHINTRHYVNRPSDIK